MRVVCVEHKTIFGGGQIALLNLLREFQRAHTGVEGCIVCPPNAELVPHANVYGIETVLLEPGAIEKTRGVVWNFAQRVAPTARLLRVVRRSRPRVIVANGAFSFLASVFAAKLARIPIVWWEHNTTLPGDAILKRMIGWATQIVVVSEIIRTQFVQLVPDAREKISVIYNGVDVDQFSETRETGSEERKTKNERLRELGWNENARVVGTVSRLAPEKGVDNFIETAAQIARMRDDVHFLLVGDGPERAQLEQRVRELHLETRVAFAGFRDDVENELRVMDVVLFPFLAEAFPLAVLEAMASARPIVATDVGGVREQLVDGETGVIVPPRDVAAMTRAVLELLRDENAGRVFGERARARVAEHFSLAQQARHMKKIFERAARGHE